MSSILQLEEFAESDNTLSGQRAHSDKSSVARFLADSNFMSSDTSCTDTNNVTYRSLLNYGSYRSPTLAITYAARKEKFFLLIAIIVNVTLYVFRKRASRIRRL